MSFSSWFGLSWVSTLTRNFWWNGDWQSPSHIWLSSCCSSLQEQSQFRKGKDWHYIGHIPHRDILLFLFCLHVLELRTSYAIHWQSCNCHAFGSISDHGIASHCLSQQDSKAHPTCINYILLFFFLFSIVKSNMKKIMFINFFSFVLF